MNDTRPTADIYTFWGGALSLFSGKVRSYLIKKGVPYREFYASHPDFKERLRPIVRLGVTPLLETPQGEVLQDSTSIIECMEQRLTTRPMLPATPVQRMVARLLDAYGTEHLMLAAMHFRWSEPYLSEQRHFLNAEFGRVAHIGTDRETRLAAGARMISYFSGMATALGITPQTAPAIEAAYFDLLDSLDIHFQHVPYLLGGHPSIGDFGMLAPLYAHLGRDPAPARLMALRAPNVARWVERMNLAVIEDAEFPDCAPAFPDDDALPPTLEPILQLMFRDWTPELQAHARCYNDWVAAHPQMPRGQLVCLDAKRRVHPTLDLIDYPLRDATIRRACAPQTLWHFDLAAAEARALRDAEHQRCAALMQRVGGEAALAITLSRPLQREDYVLALGAQEGNHGR